MKSCYNEHNLQRNFFNGVMKMLKKSSIPWTIRQLKTMYENGKLNFDIAIQRKGNIWDANRKSLLIHSLLMGFPVPPLFARVEDGIYYFIDGKQRMTTVLSYLNDEFALTDKTPDVDGTSIAGLKFSELPEEFQKVLNQVTFTITKFDNITDEEIEEMFFRLNNGVSLRTIESIRVLLGTENMKTVENLANHPFFLKKASISRKRYTDQEVVLQLLMLTENKDTGFSSKELRLFVEKIRGKKIDESLVDTVKERLDFLDRAFDKKRKYLKKIHLPMIYYMVEKAKEKGISPEYFGMWADDFYKNLDKESVYGQASQSGSAKKENVQKRLLEIEKNFNQCFNAYEKEHLVSS
jgi:DNA-binding transcriptional MerR regulator